MFFLLLLCLDLHLKIIIWASSTRTVTVSIVTIGFSHLLDFCGEHNNSGGKQLGRDHLQWERKLGTVSWYTETCFKRTCLGRQGLEGIWFYSNFILVHIDNRHDLWCNQLRYRHAVAMLSPRSRNVIATQSQCYRHAVVYVIQEALPGTSCSTIKRVVLLFSQFTIFG